MPPYCSGRDLAGRLPRYSLTGSAVAIKLLTAEDGSGLLVWYLGPMNKIGAVDCLGANTSGNPGFFFPFSMARIVAAFIGRARQLQN